MLIRFDENGKFESVRFKLLLCRRNGSFLDQQHSGLTCRHRRLCEIAFKNKEPSGYCIPLFGFLPKQISFMPNSGVIHFEAICDSLCKGHGYKYRDTLFFNQEIPISPSFLPEVSLKMPL